MKSETLNQRKKKHKNSKGMFFPATKTNLDIFNSTLGNGDPSNPVPSLSGIGSGMAESYEDDDEFYGYENVYFYGGGIYSGETDEKISTIMKKVEANTKQGAINKIIKNYKYDNIEYLLKYFRGWETNLYIDENNVKEIGLTKEYERYLNMLASKEKEIETKVDDPKYNFDDYDRLDDYKVENIINIRECLLHLDKATYNEYDLTSLYEAQILNNESKIILSKMLTEDKFNIEKIYGYLLKTYENYSLNEGIFDNIKQKAKSGMDAIKKGVATAKAEYNGQQKELKTNNVKSNFQKLKVVKRPYTYTDSSGKEKPLATTQHIKRAAELKGWKSPKKGDGNLSQMIASGNVSEIDAIARIATDYFYVVHTKKNEEILYSDKIDLSATDGRNKMLKNVLDALAEKEKVGDTTKVNPTNGFDGNTPQYSIGKA